MNLKAQRAAALKAAQAIAAKGDSMTPEEESQLEAKLAEVKSFDEQIARAEKRAGLLNELGGLEPGQESPAGPASDGVKAASLGAHFAKTAGERLAKARAGETSRVSVAAPEYEGAKAATDVQMTGGHEGNLGAVLTQVDRTIVQEYRRPVISDLFGAGTLSGQAVTYFVEGVREGNFETVAEGARKPQLHYTDPTPRTDALKKIAGFIKETDEMIEDLPFLVSEIDTRLLYDLALVEESQLLAGDGTGTNILGLLNRSGVQTFTAADADDNPDALYRAIMRVQRGSGLAADGLVINPEDYEDLRLRKDGNQQYYGGGFFFQQYGGGTGLTWQPPVWGLRTVVSEAVAPRAPIVGAFRQAATVYRKGGVRVEATNSNEDDFINNRWTIRAEERVAFAVRRPAAFVRVTLGADAAV